VAGEPDLAAKYDVIIVGTGFAGSFFLMRYLQRAGKDARVLVLERGRRDTKPWQLQNRLTSSIPPEDVYRNNMEPLYDEVEQVMLVSGPPDSPMRRTRPYPLPPHRFSTPDELLKKKFPDSWFHAATARASVATGKRGVCCASGICQLCPVDAKFTIQNGLAHIYDDPRVTLRLECEVEGVDLSAGVATGVHFVHDGRPERVDADVVVLAASALFNPHIMLRSGIEHRLLGCGLHEQPSFEVCVDLAGVKAYDGSTVITGNGYLYYDGEHRRDRAACMIELWSSPFADPSDILRAERGRWAERQSFAFLFDDLPQEKNKVTVNAASPRLAETTFTGHSDYTQRAVDRIPEMVAKLGEGLPIERIVRIEEAISPGHIQGTVVMGDDPATSIVDGNLVHHQIRNLLVLGAGSFPTATPILPTLTVSALSLRAADHFLSKGA
jgi:choline dehydrogenase-like flavoprotein